MTEMLTNGLGRPLVNKTCPTWGSHQWCHEHDCYHKCHKCGLAIDDQDDFNLSLEVPGVLDALRKSQGSNRDTEGLGAMAIAGGALIIGSVDAINGQGGEEVEFPVTRQELRALAAYWWTERMDCEFDWFVYEQTGRSEWGRSLYIDRRLNRLHRILGQEAMDKVIEDATARWRKLHKLSDEEWRVFTRGSDQEKETWREARWRKQEEAEALAAVRELSEDASKSEGSSDYASTTEHAIADHKCVTCGLALPKGTKHVWQGKNHWCERCFWGEDDHGTN
jgi:hypothetical protein